MSSEDPYFFDMSHSITRFSTLECNLAALDHWAKIGQMVEENPDFPLPFIQDILVGREQILAGQGTPYIFGDGE
jgi:hypothetical protein